MTSSKSKVLIILGLFVFGSCDTQEERSILTTNEKKLLDSVFSDGLKEARKTSDNLCIDLRDSLFQMYVDSIMELRLIEVDQIIND